MADHKIYHMSFAAIYPHYVAKVLKKNRTVEDLHAVITWLTGYTEHELQNVLSDQRTFKQFFEIAPDLNPHRQLITGSICGVRVETITEPLMQEIRYLDKLVDELAKGKSMASILRTPSS